MLYGLWSFLEKYSHIKLLRFKLITLAFYLGEEINLWNELAVYGDAGPLKSNTDSYAVIFVFCKYKCVYVADNAKTG